MRSSVVALAFLILPVQAGPIELPETIELTVDLARALGFEISVQLHDDLISAAIDYPVIIDGLWEAKGTVTALLDSGEDLINSRTDFSKSSDTPVFVVFPLSLNSYDAGVAIRYECMAMNTADCGKGPYVRHYAVSSLRAFVNESD